MLLEDYILRSRHFLDQFGNGLEGELITELKKAQTAILKKLESTTLNELSKNHYRAVLAETISILKEAYEEINDKTLLSMSDIAKLEYNNISNAIRTQAGIDKILKSAPNMGLPEVALKRILSESVGGFLLSDWLNKTHSDHLFRIKSVLSQGMIQGQGMNKIAREITKATGISMKQTGAIARTSIMGASNNALLETYNDHKEYIKGYKWLATLDHRTCLVCANHDGEFHKEIPKINVIPKGKFVNPNQDKINRIAKGQPIKPKTPPKSKDTPLGYKMLPPKTYDESVKFAKDNFAKEVQFNFENPERLTTINSHLSYLKNKYKFKKLDYLKTDILEETTGGSASAFGMRFNFKIGTKEFNNHWYNTNIIEHKNYYEKTINNFKKAIKEAIDKGDNYALKIYEEDLGKFKNAYEKGFKMKRHNVIIKGKETQCIISHEFGHVLADQRIGLINRTKPSILNQGKYKPKMITEWNDLVTRMKTDNSIYNISGYALTNNSECFAECFTMYDMGEKHLLPNYVVNFIEKLIKT